MNSTLTKAPRRYTHPLVFLLLIVPFGAASGFLGVTIVYLLGRAGVDPVTIAVLTGLSFLPHTLKFLYAPLVDLTLTRKQWFVMASITSAVGIALLGMVPATEAGLPWLRVLVVAGNLATAFLSMSVESLMAYNTAPGELGRTAGWFQAGNLGGGGLGGGLALVIAENTTLPWLPGVALAIICLLTGIAIRYTTEPEPHLPGLSDERHDAISHKHTHAVWRAIKRVLLDLWQVARSRVGYLGLLICFMPIGSGAAGNLFPLFAPEWGASANDVAATSGALSGLLSAFGCMVGGHFCDRMDRKRAYALFGILMSACAVLMAWAPHNLTMYYAFVLSYGFISGLCFAAFTAVTLEAIGTGAAATKYSIFASLSNTPIAYMGILNSHFYDRSGSNAGLYSDAAMGVAGVLVFLLITVASRSLHNHYLQRRPVT
jgi:PAT family beta-lactamase induction signal transducer AmpG